MARVLLSAPVVWLALAFTVRADGGRAPDPSQELRLIESTESGEDPLGIDPSTGEELDRAAARLPREPVKLPSASQGAALSSIDGVRESAHVSSVRLEAGLAHVRAQITLASRAKHAAEVAYRWPLAQDAVVTRVRVCVRQRCVEASPRDEGERSLPPRAPTGVPGVQAQPIVDANGPALALRLAPIEPEGEVVLEVETVASAPLHGGRVRFTLPARGYDPNLAPTQLALEAPGLVDVTPLARGAIDAWLPIELSAALPAKARPTARTHTERCGATPCTRRYEAAALAPPSARPTWLLLDASPSMEGPARGFATAALGALLAALPEQTSVHAIAFAATARVLGEGRAGDVPLSAWSEGFAAQLGSATYLDAALHLLDGERARIVVFSDGRFDPGSRQRELLERAHARGAELWLVHVGEREPRLVDTFARAGGVLSVGREAALAETRGDLEPLIERLRAVMMPATRSGLRAGEQAVHEHAPAGMRHRAGMSWLAHWLLRTRPAPAWRLDAAPTTTPPIAALPFVASAPAIAATATSLPRETVLSMLRSQLVPRARACLRSDRRGRGDYAVALTFHGLFAEREVADARVTGSIPSPLRGCLEALLPALTVPAFTGRVRVAYPIHTEREPPPPVIELEPETAGTLERAFGRERELR